MKLIIKLWGENGKFIARALLCEALALIIIICGLIFDGILPIFVILAFCFFVPAFWFCFKYIQANREEAEELE